MFNEPLHYSLYAPEIYVLLAITCATAYFAKLHYLYIVAVLLLLIILVFYRKNMHPIDMRENIIISPCEGKVLKIIRDDPNYLTIVVFLNVHNIHIQYFPYNGTIQSQTHKKGEFNPAYLFEKTALNERTETVMTTKYGDIHVHQIAGLIARRIVSFHPVGTRVEKGDPMGLIKFGSQVRVKIPTSNIKHICVSEDESIRIGQALCEMKY